jgi:hypothetical protein
MIYDEGIFGNLRFDELDRITNEEVTRFITLTVPEAEPEIRRVAVVGRRLPTLEQLARGRRGSPRFRVVGVRLNPGAACSAARRFPGVFVRGTSTDARRVAGLLGGIVQNRSEPHGPGWSHVHVKLPVGGRATFGTPRPFHRVTSLQDDPETAR